MEFPASQLYIMLAISGAMLGVYVSNSKDLKIGRKALIVVTMLVFVTWGQLLLATLLQNKPIANSTSDFYIHIFTLCLFAIAIATLAFLVRDASVPEVDFPS